MRRTVGRPFLQLWLPVVACLVIVGGVVWAHSPSSAASARRFSPGGASLRRPPARIAMARWIAGWSASPEPVTRRVQFWHGFADQTIRNTVFTSAAGRLARVQFSNVYGQQPLEIGRAMIGQAQVGAAVAARSNTPLTFAGGPSVVIPPGASALSDPVRLNVRRLERLAVSVFLPHPTGAPTDHWKTQQINYVATGNHALDSTPSAFRTRTTSWYFVTGVEVWSSNPSPATVVAFGDSITDGAGSRTGADASWPDDLARRLDSLRDANLSVVDAGIAGNRLLSPSRCCGESGLARFARDVLSQPSATDVIVLEGVNDLGATRNVSAHQIIAAYERMIALAHAAGLKIFGGTLTPFKGARYWTAAGETKREVINAWILHSGAFDGVSDFASAIADPRDHHRLAAAYDSGDHLHPNDAGYRAMAHAVSLSMLIRPGSVTSG